MKKLSLIIALVILLSAVFSAPAYAWPNAKEIIIDDAQFYYRIIDNKYAEIVRGSHFVPEKIDGYPVMIIDEGAFRGYYNLDGDYEPEEDEEIRDWVIPDTVTYIGDRAFERNPEIGTVKIPSSVTYIGKDAFNFCVNLKEINIPESIRHIRARTFYMCLDLKKITLHNNIEEIGDSAFDSCISLTEFQIPSELWELGDKAFLSCSRLKSLDFSNTSASLGKYSVGYDEVLLKKYKKIKNFKIIGAGGNGGGYEDSPKKYAYKNGFKLYITRPSTDSNIGSYESGDSFTLRIDNEKLSDYKTSKPKIIKLTKNGKLTALKKGTATVKVTLPSGKVYKGIIKVINNPVLKKKATSGENKGEYEAVKSISVKQGKTVSVKLFGKAKSIKNQYTSTSKAQIVSKKNDDIIKIKGKAKGTSTVKVKVNGVKTLKLKVIVK